jgi:NAD(P)-dependent dehydrogenase (short-subunit alcohol dehydrogenase family)
MDLDGKRVIVTGGALGIGAATVRAYAAAGASVASLDVNDNMGESVVKEALRQASASVLYRHCDVRNRSEVQSVFDEVIRDLGGLDAVVNSAGFEGESPAHEASDEHIDEMLTMHIKGTIHVNQAAFRAMSESGGGAIINLASASGVHGNPGSAAYSAAKGGVLAWTRTVAVEWAPHNIRANALCPAIDTQGSRERMDPEQAKALEDWAKARIPLTGALGDPDRDMAPVMIFLASDASRYITGQTLPVDGGWLILT